MREEGKESPVQESKSQLQELLKLQTAFRKQLQRKIQGDVNDFGTGRPEIQHHLPRDMSCFLNFDNGFAQPLETEVWVAQGATVKCRLDEGSQGKEPVKMARITIIILSWR